MCTPALPCSCSRRASSGCGLPAVPTSTQDGSRVRKKQPRRVVIHQSHRHRCWCWCWSWSWCRGRHRRAGCVVADQLCSPQQREKRNSSLCRSTLACFLPVHIPVKLQSTHPLVSVITHYTPHPPSVDLNASPYLGQLARLLLS